MNETTTVNCYDCGHPIDLKEGRNWFRSYRGREVGYVTTHNSGCPSIYDEAMKRTKAAGWTDRTSLSLMNAAVVGKHLTNLDRVDDVLEMAQAINFIDVLNGRRWPQTYQTHPFDMAFLAEALQYGTIEYLKALTTSLYTDMATRAKDVLLSMQLRKDGLK